ncbi:hypothetical protein [Pueribacillus sp. YX66]|uniref:hypothetical protein n=1 Tax=Pueribacillus sp. YX66 TaxID=3229242 RepID=UPI00358CECC5
MLYTTVTSFVTDYNILNAEKTTATVVEQHSKKSLFRTPTYFVTVDLNRIEEYGDYNGIENRVTSFQMKKAEQTSEVNGYFIDDHFFTLYDILLDSFVIIVLSIFLLLCLFAMLLYPFLIIVEKKKVQQKPKKPRRLKVKKKSRDEPEKMTFTKIFLTIFFVGGFMFSSLFVVNSFHKFIPLGQTKTDAIVKAKDSELEVMYFLKMWRETTADPTFTLQLLFETEDGERYEVVKEVTRHTYRKTDVGDVLEISYRNVNPYDIFVSSSLGDFLVLWVYTELYLYIVIVGAGLIYVLFKIVAYAKKRKKT